MGLDITDLLLLCLVLAGLTGLVLQIYLIRRLSGGNQAQQILQEELRAGRGEADASARALREELAQGQGKTHETLSTSLSGLAEIQKTQITGMTRQLVDLTESNRVAMERIRTTLDSRVAELQAGNEKRLEEMRRTVDEKLETTLEKRLGESFKLVSDRLEKVHQGLGEMQNLATGVGDLKRVLTNVKARGTWAEVQLGALLEQILTPDQFARNVQTRKSSREVVEYAVNMPGRPGEPGTSVWLPIDSKFPQEDYLRLQEAAERGDSEAVQKSTAALVRAVRTAARDIHDKYLEPPATTDFAIMYMATEGLYAEVLRQPGLMEDLQQTSRVVVAGPTTISAILSSLRMGFQTLAIEKRASEVWMVLAAVKTEFGKFGKVLDKMKKQISSVSRTLDETETRTRVMERRLRTVEQLPAADAGDIFQLAPDGAEMDEGDAALDEEEEPGGEAALQP
jgi:DNA recombination protein RmuC